MPAVDTAAAKAALQVIRAAEGGNIAPDLEIQAMDVHLATDLTLEDARLVVAVARNWGACTGLTVAVAMSETVAHLETALAAWRS